MGFERLFENYENAETPEECKMIGTVPSWLHGTMVRNGPGMFKIGDTDYKHWFDGMAYIQRYHFEDGKMFYSARYLESDDYKKNMRAHRIICSSFGTIKFPDPCKTLYARLSSFFTQHKECIDNCSVAFVTNGDAVYALTESPCMHRLDVDTLDSLEKVDFRDSVKLSLHTNTAHLHSDQEGNLYNMGTIMGNSYVFTKTMNPLHAECASSSHSFDQTEVLATIPTTDRWAPGYYHSFGISDNFFILFETPERISLLRILKGSLVATSFNDCMYWDDNVDVNVILFDRVNKKAFDRKVTSDPFFTFHHANAYEKDGFLVVDYCKILDPGNLDDLLMEHMRTGAFCSKNSSFKPLLHRMIIPLSVGADCKPGDDLLKNCSFAGDCHAILRDDGSIHCTDMKLCDISKLISFSLYRSIIAICAEPILVNRPGYSKEDEACEQTLNVTLENEKWLEKWKDLPGEIIKCFQGVLLVPVVTISEKDVPYVVVLDAETMEEQGRYIIPQSRIPLGFHSHYVERQTK
ncbi:unnamed protein product [Nippostrongylus brasiliensis]|uniref:Carotenoid isomerooxygenase (inferred by orthology to a D. melanogaster protein) n=1 Tax=Nippostrongylus brasiliensis TaxID=27835 RepID=A0A158R1Z2_NIPBR|nr:unnamed protein product [Nippostrongylus brasiliensis]